MANDTDTQLTRYTSAVTIVTADVMNRLYGGEYGYNTVVDAFHPLVAGHVHDGTHANGRSSKVLLTDGGHVRGQLAHANLGGYNGTIPAVQHVNIQSYSDLVYGSPASRRAAALLSGDPLVNLAIPEYIENPVSGEKKYYLDLSSSAGGSDKNVQFNDAGAFGGDNGFVYDYDTSRVGIGTVTPVRALHIVDAVNPPIRITGIPSGSGGTPLGIDANGDFYTDAAIGAYTADGQGIELTGSEFSLEIDVSGDIVLAKTAAGITALNDAAWWDARKIQGVTVASPLAPSSGDVLVYDGVSEFVSQAPAEQNLFSTVTVAADGGTAAGGPVEADSATDTLNLTAGAGITLTATAGTDTVKIAAGAPSGVPTTTATQVMPHNLCSHGANPSDDKIYSGTGTAAGDVCALSKNYPASGSYYASFPVAVPKNASGANPASFVVTTAWVGEGSQPDGEIATGMSYSDSGGIDVQVQGDPFSFTWAADNVQTLIVGNLKVGIATHASVALATSNTGYIHIRIGRIGEHEEDEYEDDVHLIYCQIEWTW